MGIEKGYMKDELMELVESNMHGYVQRELAELKLCAPDVDARKKYFNKNVGAYYRAMNETVTTEQKIKVGGYGNATTKNLTINMSGLGLVDKQRLLAEMTDELKVIGEKLGYGKKCHEGKHEVKRVEVAVVNPAVKRISDDEQS
jgi:hypothetical protein